MTIGLTALVDRYLTERRTWASNCVSAAYSLRSLAEYVRRTRHRGPLTLEKVMAQWARLDSHASVDPRTWARRLKQLRSFTRWMQQFEPATEVPDDTIFGRLPERQAPHIYSQEEVQQLLAAASARPQSGLRGSVHETLFGLIASCGLRLSEALSLNLDDVESRRGLLDDPAHEVRQVAPGAAASEHSQGLVPIPLDSGRGGAPRRDDDAPFFIGTRVACSASRCTGIRWSTSLPRCAANWGGSTVVRTTHRASMI